MNLFGNYYTREGKGESAPASGWPRAGVMALTHFWKLIAANFLFVVFSLPLFSMPAALTALNRVCVIIYRDGNIFLWHEFWKEFTRSFTRSIPPGIGFGILLYSGYFFMSLGNGNPDLGFLTLLMWSVGIFMTMMALAAGEFFFVMISVLEIRNADAFKNSLIMCFSKPGRSFMILVILLAVFSAAATLMPIIGTILIALILAVLAQYPICYMVYDLIEQMILLPFEKQQEEQEEEES